MSRTVPVLGLLICVIFVACGPNIYLNPTYQFEQPESRLRLAVLPAPGEDGPLIDSVFEIFFNDSSRAQQMIKPTELRQRLSTDEDITAILQKVYSANYSKDDLKAGVRIQDVLNDNEYNAMRSFLDVDIAVVPIAFNMTDLGTVAGGKSTMRVFDLRTGSLILEDSRGLNVNVSGHDGKVWLAAGLIGFAKDTFDKHFWNKYVAK